MFKEKKENNGKAENLIRIVNPVARKFQKHSKDKSNDIIPQPIKTTVKLN
jgi:hypothetical protein